MRTRALAVGSDRSNAIGPLELECTPEGLVIVHRGVRSFREGYAPGAATAGTRVVIPWTSIRAAHLEADRLFLELDAAITPHHRLLLAAFSEGDPPDPVELRRRRLLVRVGTAATLLVAATLTAITAARVSSTSGAGSAILLGCLSAGVVLLVGLVADERLALLGRASDAARMAFVSELSLRFPGLVTSTAPSTGKPPIALPEWSFQALLPRSTAAIVITMSAALLGAVLTASWISRTPSPGPSAEREAPATRAQGRAHDEEQLAPAPVPNTDLVAPRVIPTVASAGSAPPDAPAAPAPAANADSTLLAGTCTCRRSDSLLWRDGLPRVSMVLIERHLTVHHGHDHLDLELGIVNNSDAPLPEVSLVVHFYEKDPPPSTKRVHTFDRPVYFEGPFAAGQAIKWHVEARGNDFDVEGLPSGTLDPSGSDTAPTTLLAELLRANHRPVRLHGAMMLAYVGDARAREGALGLREALREDEAPYLDRLTWALHPIRTCDVQVQQAGISRTIRACVWNGTAEPQKGLSLRVRALDRPFLHTTPIEAPPLVIAEKAWTLSGDLAPNQGSIATVLFDPSNADGITPAAFEAHAE